jgi:hypothetical protein
VTSSPTYRELTDRADRYIARAAVELATTSLNGRRAGFTLISGVTSVQIDDPADAARTITALTVVRGPRRRANPRRGPNPPTRTQAKHLDPRR